MENKEVGDVAYLISLLTINGLAFVLISACYAKVFIFQNILGFYFKYLTFFFS
jgi:hypothetical protein